MRKMKFLGAVVTLALLAGLSSVEAAIVDVTCTGTVYYGYDQTGIFGTPGASLNGDSYKVTYQFNTALGYTDSSPYENYALGGSYYPIVSPALGTTVTIDGLSVSSNFIGYLDQIVGMNDGSTISYQAHYSSYYNYQNGNVYMDNYTQNYIYSYSNFTLPASITTLFSYTTQPGDSAYGYFQIYSYDYNNDTYLADTYASANITNLTYSLVGASGPAPGAGLLGLVFFVLAGLWTKARSFLSR